MKYLFLMFPDVTSTTSVGGNNTVQPQIKKPGAENDNQNVTVEKVSVFSSMDGDKNGKVTFTEANSIFSQMQPDKMLDNSSIANRSADAQKAIIGKLGNFNAGNMFKTGLSNFASKAMETLKGADASDQGKIDATIKNLDQQVQSDAEKQATKVLKDIESQYTKALTDAAKQYDEEQAQKGIDDAMADTPDAKTVDKPGEGEDDAANADNTTNKKVNVYSSYDSNNDGKVNKQEANEIFEKMDVNKALDTSKFSGLNADTLKTITGDAQAKFDGAINKFSVKAQTTLKGDAANSKTAIADAQNQLNKDVHDAAMKTGKEALQDAQKAFEKDATKAMKAQEKADNKQDLKDATADMKADDFGEKDFNVADGTTNKKIDVHSNYDTNKDGKAVYSELKGNLFSKIDVSKVTHGNADYTDFATKQLESALSGFSVDADKTLKGADANDKQKVNDTIRELDNKVASKAKEAADDAVKTVSKEIAQKSKADGKQANKDAAQNRLNEALGKTQNNPAAENKPAATPQGDGKPEVTPQGDGKPAVTPQGDGDATPTAPKYQKGQTYDIGGKKYECISNNGDLFRDPETKKGYELKDGKLEFVGDNMLDEVEVTPSTVQDGGDNSSVEWSSTTVKKGQTLSGLSKEYGVSQQEILDNNKENTGAGKAIRQHGNEMWLYEGKTIKVPKK